MNTNNSVYNYIHVQTLGCIRSPSFTNSAVPLPARARPSTRAVEAPEPIPNVKHLCGHNARQHTHSDKRFAGRNMICIKINLCGCKIILVSIIPCVGGILLHLLDTGLSVANRTVG